MSQNINLLVNPPYTNTTSQIKGALDGLEVDLCKAHEHVLTVIGDRDSRRDLVSIHEEDFCVCSEQSFVDVVELLVALFDRVVVLCLDSSSIGYHLAI